jgi:hypothetical protein
MFSAWQLAPDSISKHIQLPVCAQVPLASPEHTAAATDSSSTKHTLLSKWNHRASLQVPVSHFQISTNSPAAHALQMDSHIMHTVLQAQPSAAGLL